MSERVSKIVDWVIFEAGVQPTDDNHFGTIQNVVPRLHLFIQQRPLEIASLIDFLLSKKEQGESIEYYGEIGACSGSTTFAINNFLQFKEIIIVDNNGQENPGFYITHRRNLDRNHILNAIPRVEIIGSSHEQRVINRVKQLTESNKLDVLLIDGDHSYEGVKQDTLEYYDSVREGGYILFHDTAQAEEIIRWLGEIPSVLPNLHRVASFEFNGMPHTNAFPNGIGICVFQKTNNKSKGD